MGNLLNKANLDKRICDVEENCSNTQTYREYIRESEKALWMGEEDLDSMTDKQLADYLDFIDYLWEK